MRDTSCYLEEMKYSLQRILFWGWDVYAWVTTPSLLFLLGSVCKERLMDLA